MGLSNQERQSGLYWALHRLNNIAKEWRRNPDFRSWRAGDICDLIDQTWHGFLGKHSNGAHWFIGSASTNTITTDNPVDPWTVAIVGQLEDIAQKIHEENDEYACHVITSDELRSDKFNAVDFCSIENLLEDVNDRNTYRVYRETEQIIYYLRRYDDEFTADLEFLNSLISKIQGICFGEFGTNPRFPQAYLLNKIIEILYGGDCYIYDEDKWDAVQKWLAESSDHHSLKSVGLKLPLQELARIHIDLVNDKQNRVLALLALSGCYEYQHLRQRLEALLKEGYLRQWKKLQAEINRYQKLFDERKKKNQDYAPPDELACYGHVSYNLKRDFENGNTRRQATNPSVQRRPNSRRPRR